jgi:hypothetical protein
MGLLEALAQVQAERRRVLLICYDTPYSGPLAAVRPLPEPCGVALLLGPHAGPSSLAGVDLRVGPGTEGSTGHAAFDALAGAAPSMRALPMLAALAKGLQGDFALASPAGLTLTVQIQPCP